MSYFIIENNVYRLFY